jgi:hypothetical protein
MTVPGKEKHLSAVQIGKLKKLFPDLSDDPEAKHSETPAEVYSNIINTRRNLGRKYTAKDIKTMAPKVWFKGFPVPGVLGTSYATEDLQDAIYSARKNNPELTDEEIADALNQIARVEPKAARGEPSSLVAESLSILDRIDIKLNEQEIDPEFDEEELDREEDIQATRDRFQKSYTDREGVNREIYIKALDDPDHPIGKVAKASHPELTTDEYYEQEVLPRVHQAYQETPMEDLPAGLPWPRGFPAWYNVPARKIHPKDPGPGATGHEFAHAGSFQLPSGAHPSMAMAQRKLIRTSLGMKNTPPKPGVHSQWTEEQYAEIKKHHVEEGYFTPERLDDIKNGNFEGADGWKYEDLQNVLLDAELRGELDLEKAAAGLNRVSVRQPKTKRGEPTQAMTESKKRRKIRIRVKRK